MPKAVTKTPVAKKASTGLLAPVYNLKAEKIDDFSLDKTIFGTKVDDRSISLAIRAACSSIIFLNSSGINTFLDEATTFPGCP